MWAQESSVGHARLMFSMYQMYIRAAMPYYTGYTHTEDTTTSVVSQAVLRTEVSLTSVSENATATLGFSSVVATGHINTLSR